MLRPTSASMVVSPMKVPLRSSWFGVDPRRRESTGSGSVPSSSRRCSIARKYAPRGVVARATVITSSSSDSESESGSGSNRDSESSHCALCQREREIESASATARSRVTAAAESSRAALRITSLT